MNKRIKLIISIIMIFTFTTIMSACSLGVSEEEAMKETFQTCFNDFRDGNIIDAARHIKDYEKLKNAISDMTTLADEKVDFDMNHPIVKVFEDILKDNNTHMKYEIKESTCEKEKGTIVARIKYRDCSDIVSELMNQSIEQTLSNMGKPVSEDERNQQMADLIQNAYEDCDKKIVEKDITIYMVKDNHEWKISSVDNDLANAISAGLYQEVSDL